MADLLDRIRDELEVRLGELRPLIEEHARLAAAQRALADPDRTPRRAPAVSKATPPRSRKHAPHGANRQAVLRTVQERPGASAGEIAAVSGVDRSSLYALLARLVKTGELAKRDLPTGQTGYAPGAGAAELNPA